MKNTRPVQVRGEPYAEVHPHPREAVRSDTAMRIKDMDDVVAKLRAGADFLDLVFTTPKA